MPKTIRTSVIFALVAAMSLLTVDIAQGQEVMSKVKKGQIRGYFMFGGSTIDIDPLNSELESKGYSTHSDNFGSFGGGGHIIINRMIIGGEGHALVGEEEESVIARGSFKTSLSGFYGFFDVGYLIHSKHDLNVYPLIGIGGGAMSLKIGPDSFDDILENPRRGAELSAGGFLLNAALGTDYLMRLWKDEKGEGGLVFGLRIGYTFAPAKGGWEMDGITLSGDPEMGITGPYFRLMIGAGGIGKK